MSEKPSLFYYLEEARQFPGLGAALCWLFGAIAGAILVLNWFNPDAFKGLPSAVGYAWITLLACTVFCPALWILHSRRRANGRPVEQDDIPVEAPTFTQPLPKLEKQNPRKQAYEEFFDYSTLQTQTRPVGTPVYIATGGPDGLSIWAQANQEVPVELAPEQNYAESPQQTHDQELESTIRRQRKRVDELLDGARRYFDHMILIDAEELYGHPDDPNLDDLCNLDFLEMDWQRRHKYRQRFVVTHVARKVIEEEARFVNDEDRDNVGPAPWTTWSPEWGA